MLIGRFESGVFKVANGHIYFGNDVFKMRYDLIKRFGQEKLTQQQFFDKYIDIFPLQNDEIILSSTPIICSVFKKFVYIVRNIDTIRPNQLLILPFLHEKRVYLHRLKENTQYFYSSIAKIIYSDEKTGENYQSQFSQSKYQSIQDQNKKIVHQIICMNITEYKYYVFSERGLLVNRVDFSQNMLNYLSIQAISPDGRNYVILKKQNIDSKEVEISIFHLSEYQFQFVKTIQVQQQIKNYIDNLQTSKNIENTQLSQNKKERKNQGNKLAALLINKNAPNSWIFDSDLANYQFQINDKMDVIIKISQKKVQEQNESEQNKIHKQNTQINKTLNENQQYQSQQNYEINKESSKYLNYKSVYYFQGGSVNVPSKRSKLIDNAVYDLLFPNKDSENKSSKSRRSQNFIFFHDKNHINLIISDKEQQKEITLQQLCSDPEKVKDIFMIKQQNKFTPKKYLLHNKHLILWDAYQVMAINIDTKIETKVDFQIQRSQNQDSSEYQQSKKISDVRIGSNSKYMAITVNIDMSIDCIIIWNIKTNQEKIAIDVSKNYEILWDKSGYPYIIEQDKIWLIKERIFMKCYENQNIKMIKNLNKYFNCSQGHRFDGDKRNFFINGHYLSMPFSFMNFVIKDKIEIKDPLVKNNIFDPTPYNYLFNNSTAFLDGSFVRQNHQELEYVLKNLYFMNSNYLNQLHYQKNRILPYINTFQSIKFTKIRETALHIAVKIGNNRTIDLLMKYLSLNPTDASHFYKDIMPQLVDQSAFKMFLKSLRFQNNQMIDKQILNFPQSLQPYKQNIIAINDSNKQFIDQQYFSDQNKFQEADDQQKKLKCYPVNIQAMTINWILNSQNKKSNNTEDDDDEQEIDYGYQFLYAIQNSQNLDIFEDPTIIMLIEYFYSKYLPRIKTISFPYVLLQISVFFATIYQNENKFIFLDQQDPNLAIIQSQNFNFSNNYWVIQFKQHQSAVIAQQVLTIVNIILTVQELLRLIHKFLHVNQKMQFITDIWNCLNISYVGLNIALSILILMNSKIEIQRSISSFLVILVLIKLLYYLKLIEQIARHIDIFFIIIQNIGSFMMVYSIMMFAFGNSYYLLGKNQIQFDVGTIDKAQKWASTYAPPGTSSFAYPQYIKLQDAIFYFYSNIGIGGGSSPDIYADVGTGTNPWFIALYCLAASLVKIHLLNMLIALMGNIFISSNEIYSKIKIKEQLTFILDNWLEKQYVITDIEKVKYIICAFYSLDEDQK